MTRWKRKHTQNTLSKNPRLYVNHDSAYIALCGYLSEPLHVLLSLYRPCQLLAQYAHTLTGHFFLVIQAMRATNFSYIRADHFCVRVPQVFQAGRPITPWLHKGKHLRTTHHGHLIHHLPQNILWKRSLKIFTNLFIPCYISKILSDISETITSSMVLIWRSKKDKR